MGQIFQFACIVIMSCVRTAATPASSAGTKGSTCSAKTDATSQRKSSLTTKKADSTVNAPAVWSASVWIAVMSHEGNSVSRRARSALRARNANQGPTTGAMKSALTSTKAQRRSALKGWLASVCARTSPPPAMAPDVHMRVRMGLLFSSVAYHSPPGMADASRAPPRHCLSRRGARWTRFAGDCSATALSRMMRPRSKQNMVLELMQ
mmetsp:Transcript_32017/g.108730  ORF Transcript_32017/g.108730 Transcript_32017/m.108730 type:complete len:207 (-) Transcript_32017:4-624(-)